MSSSMPSPFRLVRFADKYQNVQHNLSPSEAESLTMKELLDMADKQTRDMWDTLTLSYTDYAGHPDLREEIAKLHGVDKDHVSVVSPQEALYIAMNSLYEYLLHKNNKEQFHAIVMFPAYQTLLEILQNRGCDVTKWAAELKPNGWTFDMDKLKSSVKSNTRLLVMNLPHNPTGYLPSASEWQDIIDFCKEREIFIFCDEMYSHTNNDGTASLSSVCNLYDNNVSVFGLAKGLALPGLRVGWLCTRHRELMALMTQYKDYLTYCQPAPSEILAIIALRNIDKIKERTLQIVTANLDMLDDFFSKHSSLFIWHRPRACLTAFVKLQGWLLTVGEGGANGLSKELAEKHDIMLQPSTVFEYQDEYVRFGFGRKDLKTALAAFDEFIMNNKA